MAINKDAKRWLTSRDSNKFKKNNKIRSTDIDLVVFEREARKKLEPAKSSNFIESAEIDSINEFDPSELEHKCRFYDINVDLPIMENDPMNISLDGDEDPFHLKAFTASEKEEVEEKQKNDTKKPKLVKYETTTAPPGFELQFMITRTDRWINDMIKENSSLYVLRHQVQDLQRSIDDWTQYYASLNSRLRKVAKCIELTQDKL